MVARWKFRAPHIPSFWRWATRLGVLPGRAGSAASSALVARCTAAMPDPVTTHEAVISVP